MRFQQLEYTIVDDGFGIKIPTRLNYEEHQNDTYSQLMRYIRLIYDETKDDVLWSTGGHTLITDVELVQDGDDVFLHLTVAPVASKGWRLCDESLQNPHWLTIAVDYGESPADIIDAIKAIDTYVEIPDDDMNKIFEGGNIVYKDAGGADFSGVHASGYPTVHKYYEATQLKGATKQGKTFGGWFTTADTTGNAITTIPEMLIGDIVLYAKWN